MLYDAAQRIPANLQHPRDVVAETTVCEKEYGQNRKDVAGYPAPRLQYEQNRGNSHPYLIRHGLRASSSDGVEIDGDVADQTGRDSGEQPVVPRRLVLLTDGTGGRKKNEHGGNRERKMDRTLYDDRNRFQSGGVKVEKRHRCKPDGDEFSR